MWSAVLVLTGGFAQLIEYTGFAVVLFSGIAGVALFVLRRRAAGRAASVQGVGLSVRAGAVRRRERADRDERGVAIAGALTLGRSDHRGRIATLRVAVISARRGERDELGG